MPKTSKADGILVENDHFCKHNKRKRINCQSSLVLSNNLCLSCKDSRNASGIGSEKLLICLFPANLRDLTVVIQPLLFSIVLLCSIYHILPIKRPPPFFHSRDTGRSFLQSHF